MKIESGYQQMNIIPTKFKLENVIQEDHKPTQIYSVQTIQLIGSENTYLASVGGNCVSVYELCNEGSHLLQGYLDNDVDELFYACCWSKTDDDDELLLLAAGLRGIIKCINCKTFQLYSTMYGHGNSINDLKTHPTDDSLLFSCSKDESIRLWNIYTSVCIAIFAGEKGHRDEVLSLDIHMQGHCFVSTGMDTSIKVWSIADPAVTHAITLSRSYTHINRQDCFKPITIQLPLYMTTQVHSDYVDAVKWYGDCIVTKSTKNRIALWSPDSHRYKGAHVVLREYEIQECDIWFVRMDICIPLDLLAIGNKHGKVFVYSLSGTNTAPNSNTDKSSMKATMIKSGTGSWKSKIETNISSSSSSAVATTTSSSTATTSGQNIPLSPGTTTNTTYITNFHRKEVFETSSPQKPLFILSHPKCTSTVRHIAFTSNLKHLIYGCDDGSLWIWNIALL